MIKKFKVKNDINQMLTMYTNEMFSKINHDIKSLMGKNLTQKILTITLQNLSKY